MMDKALQARFEAGNPVKVGIWCWLYGSQDCQSNHQIGAWDGNSYLNRNLDGAKRAYAEAGIEEVQVVETVVSLKMPLPKGNMQ